MVAPSGEQIMSLKSYTRNCLTFLWPLIFRERWYLSCKRRIRNSLLYICQVFAFDNSLNHFFTDVCVPSTQKYVCSYTTIINKKLIKNNIVECKNLTYNKLFLMRLLQAKIAANCIPRIKLLFYMDFGLDDKRGVGFSQ